LAEPRIIYIDYIQSSKEITPIILVVKEVKVVSDTEITGKVVIDKGALAGVFRLQLFRQDGADAVLPKALTIKRVD
jgi:hypothetical protein